MKEHFFRYRWLGAVMLVSFLIQLWLLVPGFSSADTEVFFSRPDSSGYLAPAKSLAVCGSYLESPGGEPSVLRAPGFPAVAAVCYFFSGADSAAVLCIVLTAIGVLAAVPVFIAGKTIHSDRTGLIAAALYSFNPTVMANRPMLLSDTLFGFFAALQLCFFLLFLKRRRIRDFVLTLAVAGAGALIRPINSVWFIPALFILAVLPEMGWKSKLKAGVAGVAVFFAVITPWQIRNAVNGAGFCIDVNTGAMYHQNGAMILAEVNGTDYETEKQRILAENEQLFTDRERFPDWKSREEYRIGKFKELLIRYPHIWIPQHFSPYVLLPDIPTLCEVADLGGMTANRGTLNVLKTQGVVAAVKHYFHGKIYLPFVLIPLLIPVILTYAGTFVMVLNGIKLRRWIMLLTVLAFVEYYFFLPGAITVPRYQIPALPLMTVLAALQLRIWKRFFVKRFAILKKRAIVS